MSGNLSVSSQPLIWNEKTVLENGIPFLNQKKEELSLYQDLWMASIGADFYNSSSKTAAEKFKATSEKSRKEIEVLDKAVALLLDVELAKNPLSEKAKQLVKITLASRHGLNYLTSTLNDARYPTHLNRGIREAALTSNKYAFSATVLTVAALFFSNITDYALPSYYSIPWKISMATLITFNIIYFINVEARMNPAIEQVKDLRNIFEQAIAPKKAAA